MFDLTPDFLVMLAKELLQRTQEIYRADKTKITHKLAKESRSRPPS